MRAGTAVVAFARIAAAVIGVVTTSYPRSADDGAGVFVRERVRVLLDHGEEVEIVAAGDRRTDDEPAVTRVPAGSLFYAGGAPEALEEPQLGRRLAAWGQAFGFSCRLLGELAGRARRWRRVESHWLLPCGLAVVAALPGVPHRAHVHGGDLYLLERLPWADSLARLLCKYRPELVFASVLLRERFTALAGASVESFGARCRVEAAPFDPSRFRRRTSAEREQARRELGLGGAMLLGAGRLQPIKGFDLLVAAAGRLEPAWHPTVLIAGEGPERARLVHLAHALNLDLRLPGLLGQRALARTMAAADLFVHPCRTLPGGRSEGMPLVVREALARGLPVIASASGGLAELRGTEGLTLVGEGDVAALAKQIGMAFRSLPGVVPGVG
jgi:glycosyltransferase involved in cell wall biosynthesis